MSPQESDSTYIQLSRVQGLLAKLVSYRFKLTKISRESFILFTTHFFRF